MLPANLINRRGCGSFRRMNPATGLLLRGELDNCNASATTAALVVSDCSMEAIQEQLGCSSFVHLAIEKFAAQSRSFNQRWPLILIVDFSGDALSHDALLAFVRDYAGERVLLWSETADFVEMLALGFRRHHNMPGVFVFDLFDYKKSPEWFNADDFAHPHCWGATG